MSYAIRNGLPYVRMVPGETLDWSRDWSDELDGDTIVDSTWGVPAGMTKGAADFGGPYTTQRVTAIETGEFPLVNEVTDSDGQKRIRTLVIEVVEAL